jgi:hypothetical protein
MKEILMVVSMALKLVEKRVDKLEEQTADWMVV